MSCRIRKFGDSDIAQICENGYTCYTERLQPTAAWKGGKSMSATRKRPPALPSKPKEEVNKKALIWLGVAFAVIVIGVSVLLIVS
jgi:hypothetical protein